MADAGITTLLEQIARQGEAYKKGAIGAREDLLATSDRLHNALLTPTESMMFTHWAQPTRNTVMRFACEIGLFEALAADGGSPKAIKSIHTNPPVDPSLLGRVLRHLATTGVVSETQSDTFGPTPLALFLATEPCRDMCEFMNDHFNVYFNKVTPFLKQNGYKAPDSMGHTPFHLAFDAPPEPLFAYWAKKEPIRGKQFASMMQVYTLERPMWFQDGYYPIKDRLIHGADTSKDSVFLVDLGSGWGHDASRLLGSLGKDIPGKVVIQDRAEIIQVAEKEGAPELVKMAHDFFTEQPVKGARAYFMHSIIHDWPDEQARQILRSIVPAMKPGYSKILINDCVIADQGAHWLQTTFDWLVLTALGARERTANEFHSLVEGTGLKITNIFAHPQGNDSLIEMELAS